MKKNESSAKINTVIFYVLSRPEYNHHDFGRKIAKSEAKLKGRLFFFRDHHDFGKKVKYEFKTLFLFM